MIRRRSIGGRTGRLLVFAGVATLALAAASAIDRPVARLIAGHPLSYSYDLYAMFRLAGFLPVWVIVAAAFILIDSRLGWRHASYRGGSVLVAVTLAGAAAELLKILIRRERPNVAALEYVFHPWREDTLSTSGLGWPSSHTAVAFAAVWLLCRMYPAASVVWLVIGVGCALTRIVGNDHFVSDVVGGILLAYAVVMLLPIGRSPAGDVSTVSPVWRRFG